MVVVLLHPLPLDGSVWDEVVGELVDEPLIVPSLYALGASCAAEVAYVAPDRVERLVIVGGKLGHRPEPSLRDEALRVVGEEGPDAAWARYWRPLFGRAVDETAVTTARRCLFDQQPDDIMRGLRVFHGRHNRFDLCDRWGGRLDVVGGAEDPAPTPVVAARALERAGGSPPCGRWCGSLRAARSAEPAGVDHQHRLRRSLASGLDRST